MKIKACIPTVLAALSLFILPASAEPLSPPGTGTVIDSGTDEDGKEFYTIQAPDKAVFYLIIDRQRGTENVYFLDAVAAKDLLSLAEPEKKPPVTQTTAAPTGDSGPACTAGLRQSLASCGGVGRGGRWRRDRVLLQDIPSPASSSRSGRE